METILHPMALQIFLFEISYVHFCPDGNQKIIIGKIQRVHQHSVILACLVTWREKQHNIIFYNNILFLVRGKL
jgi:hypothetical protein